LASTVAISKRFKRLLGMAKLSKGGPFTKTDISTVDVVAKSSPQHKTKKKSKPKRRRVKPDRERLSGGEQVLWRDGPPKDHY
jgi:hypothetical protein